LSRLPLAFASSLPSSHPSSLLSLRPLSHLSSKTFLSRSHSRYLHPRMQNSARHEHRAGKRMLEMTESRRADRGSPKGWDFPRTGLPKEIPKHQRGCMAVGVLCAERLTLYNALCLVSRRLTIVPSLILVIGIVYTLPLYRYLYSTWNPNHHRHIPDQITILPLQAWKRSLRHLKNGQNRRNTSPPDTDRTLPAMDRGGYGLWSLVWGGPLETGPGPATVPENPAAEAGGP